VISCSTAMTRPTQPFGASMTPSSDLHFGADAPAGKEQESIPTEAGNARFPCVRLHSPGEAFFDEGYALGQIEEVNFKEFAR
jgi:hypothetical protein